MWWLKTMVIPLLLLETMRIDCCYWVVAFHAPHFGEYRQLYCMGCYCRVVCQTATGSPGGYVNSFHSPTGGDGDVDNIVQSCKAAARAVMHCISMYMQICEKSLSIIAYRNTGRHSSSFHFHRSSAESCCNLDGICNGPDFKFGFVFSHPSSPPTSCNSLFGCLWLSCIDRWPKSERKLDFLKLVARLGNFPPCLSWVVSSFVLHSEYLPWLTAPRWGRYR